MRAIVLKVLTMAALILATTATVYGDTPAIMFIIDHSTSMIGSALECQGGGGCDPTGNRFRVTRALIDSIANVSPNAEVGIVVFSNGLVLDSDRDANLVRFADVDASDSFGVRQAYMPLKPLNAPAVAGGTNPFYTGANPTILDLYRSMFTQTRNSNWGISGGPAEIGGTNISLAFAAALKAIESTTIAKENQFIVFICDGEASLRIGSCPTTGDTAHSWCNRLTDFEAGTNTPTTFTIFLHPGQNPQIPASLATMTNNIRTNGYSINNTNSAAHAISSSYQPILDLLMENIIGNNVSVLTPDRVIPTVKPPEEATVIAPTVILAGEFTAGPNPVSKESGSVKFYRQGKRVSSCELRIYDANGNIINNVKINDNVIGTQARRQVGKWDLCDKIGRIVSEGTYVVRGVLKTSDGKSEKISLIIGVR